MAVKAIGQEAEVRFSPPQGPDSGYRFRSPEEVAKAGFVVFPESLDETFGPGAGDRYRVALGIVASESPSNVQSK